MGYAAQRGMGMGFGGPMGYPCKRRWFHKNSMGYEGLWVNRSMGYKGFDCTIVLALLLYNIF
jgi:hypothetical protein